VCKGLAFSGKLRHNLIGPEKHSFSFFVQHREVMFRRWIEGVKKKERCSFMMKTARFVEKPLTGSNGTKGAMF
jgi:hypothetical protein